MERVKPPPDISPRDFFIHWIVDVVNSDEDRRCKLRGTEAAVVFDLQGDGGGLYTVRIADGRVSGHEGDCPDANLRVRTDIETWRQLNSGELSAPHALLRRRLKMEGDFLLGLKLHLILA